MPEPEIITVPPPTEGAVVEPTSITETPPSTQVPVEPQPAASTQVESVSKEPQVPEPLRRRPSDYYKERQKIRSMEETMALQSQKLEELTSLLKKEKQPSAPNDAEFDPNLFSPDHKRILLAREARLQNEINSLKQEVSGFKESQVTAEKNRKSLEALEKLFPKSSPDSTESLQERVRKDPERAERIKAFLEESGLDQFSMINPDLAVEIAMQKLAEKPAQPNPTVIKKALMGGAGTGNPSLGGKRQASEDDLRAELKKLSDQASENPILRLDETHRKRKGQVMADLERLVKEKRG